MGSTVMRGGTVVSTDLSQAADVKVDGGVVVGIGRERAVAGACVLLHAGGKVAGVVS